ncbi:MAG TPA: FecR domain-containing protein [Thermoanaerobaculia bacterium]|nr:FecR domain-containing protein [Thermoanaerobaculia bacterium]
MEGAAAVERAGVTTAAADDRPLFTGDRLTTARGARVEVRLGDETAIFVAGDGEVVFATLAGEGAEAEPANLLLLERGELLLASEGGAETRVDTDNASVYVGAGSYRIERTDDATLVIARRGEAELRTRRGMVSVAEGEQGWIEGDGTPVVARAADVDALERWAAALDQPGERLAFEDEGDSDLAYDDFPFGFWDFGDVGSECERDCGGRAVRTRPPHPPDEPGRWAVPIDDDPQADADGGIEVAIAKPWPLDDAGDDGAVPMAKPPLEETADEASVEGAFLDSTNADDVPPKPADAEPASADAELTISDLEPATSEVEPASVDVETSGSTTTDDSSTSGESASSADAGDTAADSGTGSSAPAEVEAPSQPDHNIEPNR